MLVNGRKSDTTSFGLAQRDIVTIYFHFFNVFSVWHLGRWFMHLLGKIKFWCSQRGENHKARDLFKSLNASKARLKEELSGMLAFCMETNFTQRAESAKFLRDPTHHFESPCAPFRSSQYPGLTVKREGRTRSWN